MQLTYSANKKLFFFIINLNKNSRNILKKISNLILIFAYNFSFSYNITKDC